MVLPNGAIDLPVATHDNTLEVVVSSPEVQALQTRRMPMVTIPGSA